ncbi:hypothetical protein [Streptomyces triticiradicis]|uniref:hypothetical protein n=1 Tax=Streptomyces triticiradicis TaxID=2651189 RepID=UPI001CECA40E|nr:hypothetical protein [Streptomyces triticiradicis]
MSHNAEHARQPRPGTVDPTTQPAPQALRTEPGRTLREPGAKTDSPDRRTGPELFPQDDRDKLTLRLQQALHTFVDSPRQAVEEADTAFDEVATQFTNSLTERRRVLRAGWQNTNAQTEELRLALRQYREITERLLHMSAPASQ